MNFRVFTLDRVLLYGGICAALAAAVVVSTLKALLLPSCIALAAFAGASYATVRLFADRANYKSMIRGETFYGLVVVSDRDVPLSRIDDIIEGAIAKWVQAWPDRHAAIVDAFEGAVLVLTSAPLRYDARHVAGLAEPQWMAVHWPEGATLDSIAGTIAHEAEHIALYASGIPDYSHHDLMECYDEARPA